MTLRVSLFDLYKLVRHRTCRLIFGRGHAEEDEETEYVMNAMFPEMPPSVPLTYTLTVHACLSAAPGERPTFSQVVSQCVRSPSMSSSKYPFISACLPKWTHASLS